MKKLSFTTTDTVVDILRRMQESGLYGATRSDVIDGLLREKLREKTDLRYTVSVGPAVQPPAQAPTQPSVQAPIRMPALWLLHHGTEKIKVIKCICEYTGLGLKEAKELSEATPCMLNCPPETRFAFATALRAEGASVEWR